MLAPQIDHAPRLLLPLLPRQLVTRLDGRAGLASRRTHGLVVLALARFRAPVACRRLPGLGVLLRCSRRRGLPHWTRAAVVTVALPPGRCRRRKGRRGRGQMRGLHNSSRSGLQGPELVRRHALLAVAARRVGCAAAFCRCRRRRLLRARPHFGVRPQVAVAASGLRAVNHPLQLLFPLSLRLLIPLPFNNRLSPWLEFAICVHRASSDDRAQNFHPLLLFPCRIGVKVNHFAVRKSDPEPFLDEHVSILFFRKGRLSSTPAFGARLLLGQGGFVINELRGLGQVDRRTRLVRRFVVSRELRSRELEQPSPPILPRVSSKCLVHAENLVRINLQDNRHPVDSNGLRTLSLAATYEIPSP